MRRFPKRPSSFSPLCQKSNRLQFLGIKGNQHNFLGRKDSFIEKREEATKTVRKKTDLGGKVQEAWKETIKLRTSKE